MHTGLCRHTLVKSEQGRLYSSTRAACIAYLPVSLLCAAPLLTENGQRTRIQKADFRILKRS